MATPAPLPHYPITPLHHQRSNYPILRVCALQGTHAMMRRRPFRARCGGFGRIRRGDVGEFAATKGGFTTATGGFIAAMFPARLREPCWLCCPSANGVCYYTIT
eukprot:3681031-Pyramimonas_sp.AAC.1